MVALDATTSMFVFRGVIYIDGCYVRIDTKRWKGRGGEGREGKRREDRGKRNKRMRMFIGISETPLTVKKIQRSRKHSLEAREVRKVLEAECK